MPRSSQTSHCFFELVRNSATVGLLEITFRQEDRYGIKLGEGTTYKVEQKEMPLG